MILEQIAQQAMKYLDSVGVAADYEIENEKLLVATDARDFVFFDGGSLIYFIDEVKTYHPQKSPA